jgi:hypothetical protein
MERQAKMQKVNQTTLKTKEESCWSGILVMMPPQMASSYVYIGPRGRQG